MIDDFLKDIDRQYKSKDNLTLRLIGSTALFLQSSYQRGTKDSDIFELEELPKPIKNQLNAIAGKDSPLAKRYKIHLDFVVRGLPFLPPNPIFHSYELDGLIHLKIETLDIIDVMVSKLLPFRSQDLEDIEEMARLGLINAEKLEERFILAMDGWLLGSRASQIKSIIQNLNTVQRDILFVPESKFDLPDWIDQV